MTVDEETSPQTWGKAEGRKACKQGGRASRCLHTPTEMPARTHCPTHHLSATAFLPPPLYATVRAVTLTQDKRHGQAMKVIGIDPGSRFTGYGIIEKRGNQLLRRFEQAHR